MSPKSSFLLRRRLASELRRLRIDRDLTAQQVGTAIGCSESKISRLETAESAVRLEDLAAMLDLYEITGDQRAELVELCKQSRRPSAWRKYTDAMPRWFSKWVQQESEARVIRYYEAQLVPGLFQTADYAHAIFGAGPLQDVPEEVDRKVKLRMARQELLVSDDPPQISAVLDEAVLRRRMGGAETMRAQLQRLLEVGKLHNVELQVLPFSAGVHPAVNGAFTILEFEPETPKAVYLDTLTTAIFPDRPRDLGLYSMAFEQLRGAALDVTESRKLIAAVAKEYGLP